MKQRAQEMGKQRRVVLAALSTIAALAILGAPWFHIAPLSGGLTVWFERILPGAVDGTIAVAVREIPSQLVFRVFIGILLALPFLMFPASLAGREGATIGGRAVGLLLLALTIPSIFGRATIETGSLHLGDALTLAGTAITGSLLLYLSYKLFRTGRERGSNIRCRILMAFTGMSGICIASVVLLPLGILMLVPTYLSLAFCLGRSDIVSGDMLRSTPKTEPLCQS